MSVSFLMAVNSFLRVFLSSLQIVISMRQRCLRCWQILFLLFFLIHIVCQRRLWDVVTYAWSLVFMFRSIWLSSSLVLYRKGPEYLTKGTAQVFIPIIRFLLVSFVLSSFLVYYYYYYYSFVMLHWLSHLFTLFSHQHLKNLYPEHMHQIQYINTNKILLIYLSDSSQECPLNFIWHKNSRIMWEKNNYV